MADDQPGEQLCNAGSSPSEIAVARAWGEPAFAGSDLRGERLPVLADECAVVDLEVRLVLGSEYGHSAALR